MQAKDNSDTVHALISAMEYRDFESVDGGVDSCFGRISLIDKNADSRIRAAKALGEIRNPIAIQPLIKALQDEGSYEGERVCNIAAESLTKIGIPAVQPLIKALKDKKYHYDRATIAFILGEIGNPIAIEALGKVLNNSTVYDSDLVRVVCIALIKIGDSSAKQPLIKFLNNNHTMWGPTHDVRQMRDYAAEALVKIGNFEEFPRVIGGDLLISDDQITSEIINIVNYTSFTSVEYSLFVIVSSLILIGVGFCLYSNLPRLMFLLSFAAIVLLIIFIFHNLLHKKIYKAYCLNFPSALERDAANRILSSLKTGSKKTNQKLKSLYNKQREKGKEKMI